MKKLPQNIKINRLAAVKTLESKDWAWFISIIVLYNDIVIAPLNKLSPNMILYNDLSISILFINGSTDTGSVDEIKTPKAKDSVKVKFQEVNSELLARKLPHETMIVEITVPINEYVTIDPKFPKNNFLSMLYPLWNIIGGSNTNSTNSEFSIVIDLI